MRTDWIVCITGLHDTEENKILEKQIHKIVSLFPALDRRAKFEEFKNANLEKILKLKEDQIKDLKEQIEILKETLINAE